MSAIKFTIVLIMLIGTALLVKAHPLKMSSDNFTVSPNPAISIQIIDKENVKCYGGCDGSIIISVHGGVANYSFEWSNGVKKLNKVSSIDTLVSLSAGNHSVTVTDGSASQQILTFSISEPPINSTSIFPFDTIKRCLGFNDSLKLPFKIKAKYRWSKDQNTGDWNEKGLLAGASLSSFKDHSQIHNNRVYLLISKKGVNFQSIIMKNNGSLWDTVKNSTLINSVDARLKFNGCVPYAVYQSMIHNQKLSVAKFNGHYWELIGMPGFSAGVGQSSKIEFNNDTAFVAYYDNVHLRVCVKKFNGTKWEPVGDSTGIPFGSGNPEMEFHNGTLFVSYSDGSQQGKATMVKFDGVKWVLVGKQGYSPGRAAYVSMALNRGVPYVAFRDDSNSSRLSVMKFNGSSWINVGAPGFSKDTIAVPTIRFVSGVPFVSFTDSMFVKRRYSIIGKTSVMSYRLGKWSYIGKSKFTAIVGPVSELLVSGNNKYVMSTRSGGGTSLYKYETDVFDSTRSIKIDSAGIYYAEIIDSIGCISKDTIAVINSKPFTLKLKMDSNIVCHDDTSAALSVSVKGGQRPLFYTWNNLKTDSVITNLKAGTYSVTVLDTAGCINKDSIVLKNPPILKAFIDSTKSVSIANGSDGIAYGRAVGGVQPYKFSWSNGQTIAIANNLSSGLISLTVTDSNGCSLSLNDTVGGPNLSVNQKFAESNFKIYPNPTEGVINFKLANGVFPFRLKNVQGQIIHKCSIENKGQIDVSFLESGIYIAEIKDSDGLWKTKQFVVN